MPAEQSQSGYDDSDRAAPFQPRTALSADLQFAIVAIAERFNACRLVSFQDLNAELPARGLSSAEVEGVLQNLADYGIKVIEEDIAERLSR